MRAAISLLCYLVGRWIIVGGEHLDRRNMVLVGVRICDRATGWDGRS